MADNVRRKPYDLKARCALAKSWLCQPLVCKQHKVASQKDMVLHSKVAMKGLDGEKKRLQHNTADLFLDSQLFQKDEAFMVSGRTHTHRHTI